jgi:outer membrane protein assembly factor BamB
MKNNLLLSLIIFIVGLVFSCGKNEDTNPTTREPYGSMSDFFLKNGAPTQVFTLNAASGGLIIGSQGTKITFPSYAFKHHNGTMVTGTISVLLREVYKKSDMLLSNLSTMNNSAPLKSGGMLSITAFQGNEQLYMANGKSYSAELPATVPSNSMRAFISSTDSAQGRNWSTIDTSLNDTTGWGVYNFYATLTSEANSYLYTTNWLGWINCDTWFGSSYPVIIVDATLSNSDYGTVCYLILNDNSAIQLYPSSTSAFSTPAPLDSSGTLIALGVKDSILYSAFVPLTITNNLEVSFTLEPTTTDDFKGALDLLN